MISDRPARWCFWLALAAALTLTAAAARWRTQWFDRVSAYASGAEAAGRNRIVPMTALDGLYWITYAQQMAATGTWRVRETDVDNAPFGREVHWSSGFAWWLVALGHARKIYTGEPLPQAIEYAAAWANPLLLMLATAGLALVAARRFGWAAGALVALAFAGAPHVVNSFSANEPDHHGLINALALGTVLCLVPALGGGRAGLRASAMLGAAGLWVSAVSLIPVLAGIGLAGVGAMLLDARTAPTPAEWRTWGRWGAGLALGFYALEYFPAHLGMRLEVNHPLYAGAWWGAAELLAEFAAWRAGRAANAPWWPAKNRARAVQLAGVLLFLAPLAAILMGSARWFTPLDPVLALVPALTLEGASLPVQLAAFGWSRALPTLAPLVLLLVLGTLAVAFARSRAERALALWPLLALLPVTLLALGAGRMLTISGALAVACIAPAAAVLGPRLTRPAGAALAAVLAVLLLAYPTVYAANSHGFAHTVGVTVEPQDLHVLALRHLAQEMRALPGRAGATVLAAPDEAVLLSYYGGFRTVGTLYWENLAGLKAAAAICATPGERHPEVQPLLVARGITLLFAFPANKFLLGFSTLALGRADQAAAERSFAAMIHLGRRLPVWLCPLPLLLPPELAGAEGEPMLYEFRPGQTLPEQRRAVARYALATGRAAEAAALLAEQARDTPGDATVFALLAQAFAHQGDATAAQATAKEARRLARATGDAALAADIERLLAPGGGR